MRQRFRVAAVAAVLLLAVAAVVFLLASRRAPNPQPGVPEAQSPAGPSAFLAPCVALATADRLDEALSCFRNAVASNPASAEAHNDFGVALAHANRTREALDQFREAVRLAPDSHAAQSNLAQAEMKLGLR